MPSGVAFADKGRLVIGGSNHGLVYVFDSKTGLEIEALRHAEHGRVQAIAVSEIFGAAIFRPDPKAGTPRWRHQHHSCGYL
jgi:hypothetical protein